MTQAQLSATYDRRTDARLPIGRVSTVRDTDTTPHDVWVTDLSRHGAGFLTSAAFTPGEAIRLGLGGAGSITGSVVRRSDGQFGCVFDAPLTDAALRQALATPEAIAALPVQRWTVTSATPAQVRYSGATRLVLLATGVATSWLLVAGAAWLVLR